MGKKGISRERETFFGEKYVQHEDSSGKIVGRSYEREDMFGNKYVRHEDERGKEIGRSEIREDIWGNEYTEYTPVDRDAGPADRDAGPGVLAILGAVLLSLLPFFLPILLPYFALRFLGGVLGPAPGVFYHATLPSMLFFGLSLLGVTSPYLYIAFLVVVLFLKYVMKKDIPGSTLRKTCLLWCVIGVFACVYLYKKCKRRKG